MAACDRFRDGSQSDSPLAYLQPDVVEASSGDCVYAGEKARFMTMKSSLKSGLKAILGRAVPMLQKSNLFFVIANVLLSKFPRFRGMLLLTYLNVNSSSLTSGPDRMCPNVNSKDAKRRVEFLPEWGLRPSHYYQSKLSLKTNIDINFEVISAIRRMHNCIIIDNWNIVDLKYANYLVDHAF